MRRTCLAAFAAAAMISPAAWGYIRISINFGDGSTVFLKRTDATGAGVQFYVNDGIIPGLQSSASGAAVRVFSSGSNPVAAIRAAAASWNGAGGSAIKFLALKATAKITDPSDKQNTIAVASSAADLSVLGFRSAAAPGAAAVTLTQAVGLAVGTDPTGDVSDSDILINPALQFSTDGSTALDLQSVMTHEFGHAMGLNHSGLLGATMFQYAGASERYLSQDELSYAAAIYPSKPSTLSTTSGRVIFGDASGAQSALVTLVDTANGNMLSALTGATGAYTVQAPAGSYVVYVEPMTAGSVVQAGNLYLSAATVVTTNFQATALGGFTTPTKVAVAAGTPTKVPDLLLTGVSSILQLPYVGLGRAGALGDIGTVTSAAAITVPSGQSWDIGIVGGGLDATASLQVIGQGISIHAGSLRVDPVKFSGVLAGATMVRATLDIAPREMPSLASVIVTQGSYSYALSGILVLVPATPTFTSAAVISAASYKGSTASGGVSPGGIYSIYDTTANSLGPAAFAQPSGYDPYGNLATSLAGVTVTFDGVPAPLYLAYAGQINLQVPFEVAGKNSTKVVVDFNGSRSAPVAVPVTPAQPAFFTFTPAGKDVITQNFPDYSLNTAANAAPKGGIVLLYGTGLGALSYALGTGQPGTVPPASYASAYSCSFGGPKAAAFGYWNYGFVGEATWTVAIPPDTAGGPVALTCTDAASGATTQQGTVYVK
ncbi:MAG: matrixin family metalloprotease [Acidobacteriota bacterium]|nr:matrixin family metalloprotease [Acidobacteriota bacterium]